MDITQQICENEEVDGRRVGSPGLSDGSASGELAKKYDKLKKNKNDKQKRKVIQNVQAGMVAVASARNVVVEGAASSEGFSRVNLAFGSRTRLRYTFVWSETDKEQIALTLLKWCFHDLGVSGLGAEQAL